MGSDKERRRYIVTCRICLCRRNTDFSRWSYLMYITVYIITIYNIHQPDDYLPSVPETRDISLLRTVFEITHISRARCIDKTNHCVKLNSYKCFNGALGGCSQQLPTYRAQCVRLNLFLYYPDGGICDRLRITVLSACVITFTFVQQNVHVKNSRKNIRAGRHQAIPWSNARILLTRTVATNIREIHTFFNHENAWKWRPQNGVSFFISLKLRK